MNRERVMQLAAAAGFGANLRSTHAVKLERLAELVELEEREACAEECGESNPAYDESWEIVRANILARGIA